MADETVTMTRRALNRATLARQMLLAREKVKPVAAVERLVMMQAQVPRPPFVGLWTRIEDFQRDDLVRAIERREIVRGTMLRGTLHLLSRKDYLAFRMAMQPMLSAGALAILKERAEGADVDTLVAAARAYFAEEPRTFAELRKHLQWKFKDVDERVMGYLVRTNLPLLMTPDADAKWAYPATADFTLADAWLGEAIAPKDQSEALALRYLAAFGPATGDDFKTWSAFANGRAIVEGLRKKLVAVRDERGRELFDLPKAPRPGEEVDAPIRYVPDFDNLVLAHADRTRLIANEHKPAMSTKNLQIPATFLVDGFVAGLWTSERTRKAATLVLKPFATLAKPVRRSLAEEGDRLLRFLEPDAETFAIEVESGAKRTRA